MVSRAEALEIVRAHVAAYSEADDLLVLEDETLEYNFDWVFFYNSEAYIRSGKIHHALAGKAPIIMDRSSGKLFETRTAEPVEAYIDAFKRFGDPHRVDSNR
jgi:Immunity protein 35